MIIHIVGPAIQIGPLLRQRCAWCGATLLDYDLERIAVPINQPGPPATWADGDLVAVDGNASYTVAHEDGDQLPDAACARIDPGVTR